MIGRPHLVIAGMLATLTGCGPDRHADASPDRPAHEVLVSAAASLTDAFAEIETAFESVHPDTEVILNLAGSSALRTQILEGAPVDVFAAADPAIMRQVEEAGELRAEPRVFAHNRLTIAVPAGNPAGIEGLADFARSELLLGLCAASVPCGSLAREALRRVGVEPAIDTEEPDVRSLLTKVSLSELDGALTYTTDIAASGGAVEAIPIPADQNVAAAYPIAVLAAAPNPGRAEVFVRFVLSSEGRTILARHGFLAP